MRAQGIDSKKMLGAVQNGQSCLIGIREYFGIKQAYSKCLLWKQFYEKISKRRTLTRSKFGKCRTSERKGKGSTYEKIRVPSFSNCWGFRGEVGRVPPAPSGYGSIRNSRLPWWNFPPVCLTHRILAHDHLRWSPAIFGIWTRTCEKWHLQ